MNEREFDGKNIFITGSTGYIGRAIAFAFANKGALVSICGRDKERVDNIIESFEPVNGRVIGICLDVRDYKSIEKAVDMFRYEAGGELHGLINCAGGGAREEMKCLSDQSVDLIKEVIEVNLLGTIMCCKKCIPYIEDGGFIINTSSVLAYTGRSEYGEYASAKAGVIGLTRSLAKELGNRSIRVNSISYGSISREELVGVQREGQMRTNYLGLYADVPSFIQVPLFLASAGAMFITGEDIVVDGGRRLALKGTEEF